MARFTTEASKPMLRTCGERAAFLSPLPYINIATRMPVVAHANTRTAVSIQVVFGMKNSTYQSVSKIAPTTAANAATGGL